MMNTFDLMLLLLRLSVGLTILSAVACSVALFIGLIVYLIRKK